MEDFCLEASPAKCWTFAIGSTMRKRMKNFRFAGGTLQAPVHAERVLGAHIPFSAKQVGGAHWDRLELAVERAKRIRWLPLAFHQREQIVSAAGIPKALAASAYGAPPAFSVRCRPAAPCAHSKRTCPHPAGGRSPFPS